MVQSTQGIKHPMYFYTHFCLIIYPSSVVQTLSSQCLYFFRSKSGTFRYQVNRQSFGFHLSGNLDLCLFPAFLKTFFPALCKPLFPICLQFFYRISFGFQVVAIRLNAFFMHYLFLFGKRGDICYFLQFLKGFAFLQRQFLQYFHHLLNIHLYSQQPIITLLFLPQ